MENNGPFGKIDVSNGVEVCFWRNERSGKDGKTFYALNVQISKRYREGDGEAKRHSVYMKMNDLYRLVSIGSQVKDIEEKFRKEVRSMS